MRHATCSDAKLAGTLTFNKVIKLYTHKCFSKYPQFQLSELVGTTKTPLTNNSTTTFVKGDRIEGRGTMMTTVEADAQKSVDPVTTDASILGPTTATNGTKDKATNRKGKSNPTAPQMATALKRDPATTVEKRT
jgi:hypothetical protein